MGGEGVYPRSEGAASRLRVRSADSAGTRVPRATGDRPVNEHPAMAEAEYSGPPAYVPVSGTAVTALVLSIVLFFVALFGPWWCEIVPILLVMLSWGALARRTRRGKAVAIIALVLALLGGGFAYYTQKTISTLFGEQLAPVVVALEKGDRAEIAKWLPEGPDRDAKIDRWVARAKAAREAEGAFKGELHIPFNLWGFMGGLIAKPDVREEFEPRGEVPPRTGSTFWFRAPCAKGDVYVAFDCGSAERFQAATKEMQGTPGANEPKVRSMQDAFGKAIEEVRFFH